MKNLLITRLALVALFILISLEIFATGPDFQVNGIYYKIISIEDRECSVYGPVYPNNNPDKIIIPSEVKYNGASFKVISVFGENDLRWKQPRYINVKELILPNTVKTIEEDAFYRVRSLEKVQMDGVEYIANNAFESCDNLKTISTSLNRLKYIGFAAFSDCRSLEKVIIPPSCEKIEASAFMGCVNPRLTVVIQDSNEPLICKSTFGSGKKIYVGRNLWDKKWRDGMSGPEHHDIYQGDIYYFKEIEFGDKVTEMLVVNPTRRYDGDLDNFPFKITIGASIKVVPDFRNDNMTIKSLYLVSQLPPLGGGFSNRTYLHGTLYVPKGSLDAYKNKGGWKNFLNIQEYENSRTIAAQKALEEGLAKEAAQKAEAERKAKEEAERKAKKEADRIAKNPVIPDGTTEIPAFAYEGQPIMSITIPNSVTLIGESAFKECRNINSVKIPNSVTCIGDEAFFGCRFLMFVTIGNGVKNIGKQAFKWCYGIKSLTIPNSVTNIGEGAFDGCTGLQSIKSLSTTPPSCGSSTFSNVHTSIPVYVPASAVSKYKSADGWKNFTNIQAIGE